MRENGSGVVGWCVMCRVCVGVLWARLGLGVGTVNQQDVETGTRAGSKGLGRRKRSRRKRFWLVFLFCVLCYPPPLPPSFPFFP